MSPQKPPSGMFKCELCGWLYPAHFVNLLRSSHPALNNKALCGICALQAANEIHGTNRTEFGGEAAEYMRLQAIEWRAKHPYDDPQKRKKDDKSGK